MKYPGKMLVIILLLLPMTGSAASANDDNVLMARSLVGFEIAMDHLMNLIGDYGYSVAHTQRCDGGMQDFGYETDFYRVIFFGKFEEVRRLSRDHPEIVPFVPLKFLIFAEDDETVVVSMNPVTLSSYFESAELKVQFQRWQNDIESILNEMRRL